MVTTAREVGGAYDESEREKFDRASVIGNLPGAFAGNSDRPGPTDHRYARHPQRHDDTGRQTTTARAPEVWRRDQGRCERLQALLATIRGAAQGRAKRAADHDR